MQEKNYKLMKKAGGFNVALGIVVIVTGVACGILMIVNGAKLLRNKADLLF